MRRTDGRVSKTEAWQITEMVGRGVDFDEAWRRVTDSPYVDARPIMQAIRARYVFHGERMMEIAKRAGVNRDKVYAVSQGKQATFHRDDAQALAEVLNIPPVELGL